MAIKLNQAVKKLELDFESLSSSLRSSWHKGDACQAAASLHELSQLYPDLLVQQASFANSSKTNYYETLKLDAAATQKQVVTNFFKQLRKVLRNKDMSHRSRSYVKLLDAGFVLRKPRLRLSHDLAAVSGWLNGCNQSTSPSSDIPAGSIQGMPCLLKLLEQSRMATTNEVRALLAQTQRAPGIPLDTLVLQAGYISKEELASLKLAETLLNNHQVELPQILVALYDERSSGVRMAESLQARGWLEVQVKYSRYEAS
jgi:hypothetical protein